MKKLFSKITTIGLFCCTLFLAHNANAQRSVNYQIYEEHAGNTDCDGGITWPFNGQSDWAISVGDGIGGDLDDRCWNKTDDNDWTYYDLHTLRSQSVICRSDWPSGGQSIQLRGTEFDGASTCVAGDYVGTVGVPCCTRSTPTTAGRPALNSGNGNYSAQTFNFDWDECGTQNSNFYFKGRWVIGGSWQTSKNQDGNGYITNTSCSDADAISGPNDNWVVRVNDHITRCDNTVWYYFDLNVDVTYVEIGFDQGEVIDGGDIDNVTLDGCGVCGISNEAGVLDEDFLMNNPKQGRYRFRVNSSQDYFDVSLRYGDIVSRPGNDDICSASSAHGGFNYNSSDFNISGSTTGASSEDVCSTNEPDNSNELSVWYTFTTGANPPTEIVFNPSANDLLCSGQLWLYSGAPAGACSGGSFSNYNTSSNFNGLSRIDYTEFGNNVVLNCPSASTTYYLQAQVGCPVNSWGGFSVNVDGNGALKAGDICTQATTLSGSPLTLGGTVGTSSSIYSNNCANPDTDPSGCSFSIQHGVWFTFTTASNVGGFVDFYGTNGGSDDIDIQLTVYEGPCGSLTEIACDYDPAPIACLGLCDEDLESVCVKPSTTYYVLVDGGGLFSALEQGTFGLQVVDRVEPANDIPCGAYTLATVPAFNNNYTKPGLTGQSNVNATNCYEPDPDWTLSSNNHGVWYKTQALGRTLVLDAKNTGGDDIDIKLAVYQNVAGTDDCNLNMTTGPGNPDYHDREWDTGIPVLCVGGLCGETMIVECLDPTRDVYIMVDGANDLLGYDEGGFELRSYYPYEGGTDFCDYNATTNWDGVRFLGNVPDGGNMTIYNLSNFCGVSSIPAGAPDMPSLSTDKAVFFKFRVADTELPGEGSVKITAYSDPVIGNDVGLLAGDEINMELMVIERASGTCSSGSWIIHNSSDGLASIRPDVIDGPYEESLIVNCLSPFTDYYLVVDGVNGLNEQGFFELYFEDYGISTPNDDQCDFIDFASDNPGAITAWRACNSNSTITLNNQNNYCGTINNEPTPSGWPASSAMIWYRFEAPKSGKLEIRLNPEGGIFDPYVIDEYINGMLAVYDLPDSEDICSFIFTNANLVASDYDVDVPPISGEDMTVECLVPGRYYYLAVDGEAVALAGGDDWDRGEFWLEFESDPRDSPAPNDNICNAEFLGDIETGPKTSQSLRPRSSPYNCMSAENNFCATSAGDPDPPGAWPTSFDVDQGVWYSFIAPDFAGNGYGSVNIDFNNNPGYATQSDYIHIQSAVFENVGANCANPQDSFSVQGFSQALTPFDNIDYTVNCLNAGELYYLLVDGATLNLEGYFDFTVSEVIPTETPPANDDICSATPMTGMWPTIGTTISDNNETNRCADLQAIPDPANFGRDHTVWYSFTTPVGGTTYAVEATVTSDFPWPFGDAIDPQIALYSSSTGSCATATTVYEFDDFGLINIPFVETTEFFCLDPATTYWIMVDGSTLNGQGNFDVDLTSINPKGPTTSDDMCDAAPGQPGDLGQIPTTTGSVASGTRNNYCATLEVGEATTVTSPLIDYTVDNTVWFSFVTPSSPGNNINVDFDANSLGGAPTSDGLDLQVAIYQSSDGTCSGTMTEIDAGWDGLGVIWDEDVNDVCLQENTRYFVQIDGAMDLFAFTTDEWRGFFNLTITANGVASRPTRDDIAHAIANPLTVTGTTLTLPIEDNNCATVQTAEPGLGTYASRTVWYSFDAPSSADVTITVDGNNCFLPIGGGIDPEIYLYYFSNPATFAGAEEIDMSYIPLNCGLGLLVEEITPLCLRPGERYYLQVDGSDAFLDGDFTLTIVDNQPAYSGPTNNFCANAIDLTFTHLDPLGNAEYATSCFHGGRAFDVESYGDATWSGDGVDCGGEKNCGETWYRFTMPSTGYVKIEGEDEYGILGINNSTLNIGAYYGTCGGSLTSIQCESGGSGQDIEYSITRPAGSTVYLSVFNSDGTDMSEDFGICLIEQCSADECDDAVAAGAMEVDSVYCFNLQTMTDELVSEAYSVGNANANPTHSTYFKFDTDDFCWGYILKFDIADIDLNNSDFCPVTDYNNLTVSIFKDATPCDGNPQTRTVIYERNDCQSGDLVSSEVSLLVGDQVPINIPNQLYDDLEVNTTYIVQIDVSAPEVTEGTISIEKICHGRDFAYPGLGITTSSGYCTDHNEWRHYFNDNGTDVTTPNTYPEYPNYWEDDIMIFSLFPNGNTIEGTAKISLLSNFTSAIDNTPIRAATYTMRRYWDFDITSGVINPTFPVAVRFYYEQSEKDEIIAVAQTFALFPALGVEPFEWFKTANGVEFSPAMVHPRYIESKAISETGQFTGGVIFPDPPDAPASGHSAQDFDEDPSNVSCNGIQYVEMWGLTGFSGGTGASGASDSVQSPLPVELVSFIGWNYGGVNELEWITVSEINNEVFVVERSIDAINFVEIGSVRGSGTTSEEQIYNFTDVTPIQDVNYYRLKQVDFDGSYEYTPIIAIDVNSDEIRTAIVKIHPNPTNRILNIQLQSANDTEFKLTVVDIAGSIVHIRNIEADRGLNSPFALDVENYPSGVFIISLYDINTGNRLEAKFMKE